MGLTNAVAIPVTVLSGFLGSGKTSILNYLLVEQQSKKIAVIVNEFGAVSLDHRFIVHREEDTIQLANGCVCCTVRSGLKTVLKDLIQRGPFDGIVVEASGVADPAPLLQTFLEADIEPWFYIDALLTVVHGEYLHEHLSSSPVTERQIRSADILLISHRDTVTDHQWRQVQKTLAVLNPPAPILVSHHGRVPLEAVLTPDTNGEARSLWRTAEAVNHDFQTVSLGTDGRVDQAKLEAWLDTLPEQGALRAKGILQTDHMAVAVHLVGRRITIEPVHRQDESESQMVVIGQNLDEQVLQAGWGQCLAKSGRRWRLFGAGKAR